MKHLITYEGLIKDEPAKPNFNSGDTVTCVDDNGQNLLTKNSTYTITKIYLSQTNGYMCHIQNLDGSFYCKRFKTQIEIDSLKFNI
jgi:hypothetical protein